MEFSNEVFIETYCLFKIKQFSTNPYHPQSNGSLERSHRILGEYLRNFVSKDKLNWNTYIQFAMFASYNSRVHFVTGYQPYELYGRKLVLPTTTHISNPLDPEYNLYDYQFKLKNELQVTHELTKKKLIEKKTMSKERYNIKSQYSLLKIGYKVYMDRKSPHYKLTPK